MSDRNEIISEGAGEPLILLHGLGYGAEYWRLQIKPLAKHFRVIAWNMPGYGGTRPLADMTFTTLSQKLATLMDGLQIEKAHILGHSMGGMLALDFVATYPARVKSLILFAASPAFPPPDSDFAKAFVAACLAPLDAGGMAAVARELEKNHFGPKADLKGVKISAAVLNACPAETYRQSLTTITTFDRRAALEGINVPTLVIAAEADINAPAKGVEKMAGKIPGAEFICLPGLGHLANLEAPDVFNRAVLDFLMRQAPPSP
jgi:pimeloyl-ACP methyl ester carboxylesterase